MNTWLDNAILKFDRVLRNRTIAPNQLEKLRTNPADLVEAQDVLSATDRKQSISMMRINHSGEICAQALYQGQGFTARSRELAATLQQAASEEIEHLHWCEQRINELNGNTSLLNPIWYAGSFAIGAVAGIAGDKISLGFLAETEYQVTAHIEHHLDKISIHDLKSRAILTQMRTDELQHATNAQQAGGVALPKMIKKLMTYTSKILTITAGKI